MEKKLRGIPKDPPGLNSVKGFLLGTDHYFPGYRDWKKLSAGEKNVEINFPPQRPASEKIVCRDHPYYARFEEFKTEILCTVSRRKKIASSRSLVEKNFLPRRNHDTPAGGGE